MIGLNTLKSCIRTNKPNSLHHPGTRILPDASHYYSLCNSKKYILPSRPNPILLGSLLQHSVKRCKTMKNEKSLEVSNFSTKISSAWDKAYILTYMFWYRAASSTFCDYWSSWQQLRWRCLSLKFWQPLWEVLKQIKHGATYKSSLATYIWKIVGSNLSNAKRKQNWLFCMEERDDITLYLVNQLNAEEGS